jgi:hypothetical protein
MIAGDLVQRTKRWLSDRSPVAYRQASLAYRSLRVLNGVRYLLQNRTRLLMGERPILIAYPGEVGARWSEAGHPTLNRIIDANRYVYGSLIDAFAELRPAIEEIPLSSPAASLDPSWKNSFFTGIDAFALYGMLAKYRPGLYLEIGSGNSTKIARRAIRNHELSTEVISIDPWPRTEIDRLCDKVLRRRLEDIDLSIIDRLQPGDVLFFDGSHYAFMSSDVVVFFLEILPRLRPGVLVHIHDVFLPYDYPTEWVQRYYSEQYLLAVALMNPVPAVEVLFPAAFVARDPMLGSAVRAKWGSRVDGIAASFWVRTIETRRSP